jgi:hypothetical protein
MEFGIFRQKDLKLVKKFAATQVLPALGWKEWF